MGASRPNLAQNFANQPNLARQPYFGADERRVVSQAYASVGPIAPASRVRARALFERPQQEHLLDVLACGSTTQAKTLLALQYLHKCGLLSEQRKSVLKRKALDRNAALLGIVQAFEVDQDLAELLDSLELVF